MKRFFLAIASLILVPITGFHNLSIESITIEKQEVTVKTNILLPEPGYTSIKEKIIQISKKDYDDCYSGNWDLNIPILTDLPNKDLRHKVNDSINKIVYRILADTLHYESNSGEISDCGNLFDNPGTTHLYYKVGKNSRKILSINIYEDYVSGGHGVGYGTHFYAFNIDILNKRTLLIEDLFDTANSKKLSNYLKSKESLNEEILFDENFNIWGHSGHMRGEIYDYVGFRIEDKSLILSYSQDFFRANRIEDVELPLKDIKPFMKKKYRWICEGSE
ncbi:hypothetical protein MYP_1496 [Sporocytophaga myxococcoides]|uniref:Deacetylase PdaC domain-containing protein n=1 Tax=Sporocytophaga myxococcoides TaxID=153721 RepID=A0A098LDX1_9BACT|nr:hypothetical protein [Sporocytophaga myxococcoides]GAL84268.1 hypothetical protein MYP_1496 [Sporocytophaga myxococcoides]